MQFIALVTSFVLPAIEKGTEEHPEEIGWVLISNGLFTIIGFIFVYFYMRESKDKTKHEIHQTYKSDKYNLWTHTK